jgi:hypothetical protein
MQLPRSWHWIGPAERIKAYQRSDQDEVAASAKGGSTSRRRAYQSDALLFVASTIRRRFANFGS